MFDIEKMKVSDCPLNVVPFGTQVFVGIDRASDGGCTVKGFFDRSAGEYHIQEIEYYQTEPICPVAGNE